MLWRRDPKNVYAGRSRRQTSAMGGTPRRRRALPFALATALAASLIAALPSAANATDTAQNKIVNADPADWTPQIQDGQVNAIVQIGTKVVVGGTFTTVRKAGTSTDLTRNYLFAFDMNTGNIDPNFVPTINAPVMALTRGGDGTSVFVGGQFNTVDGATYRGVVRLQLSNGQPVAGFRANTNSRVQDMELNNGWLYLSGKFTAVKGVARAGVARVNPDTGAVDANLDLPFADPPSGALAVQEIDVSNDGSKLVAIGDFGSVAGQTRIQIAVLDVGTTPATLDAWRTDDYPYFIPGTTNTWCGPTFPTYMRSVKISPEGTYFVVSTTGGFRANRLCDTGTRWDLTATGPNQHPTWVDWTGGDTTWSVGATGTAIYVGGHFRWWNNPYASNAPGPGAVPREGIAALDPLTGLPFSWNPSHERGVGIFTLPATPDGLWAGSDTNHTGGEFHEKIAFYPLNGGVAPPPIVTYPLPGNLYTMDPNTGALAGRSFDGTTLGTASSVPGINWTNARGAFMVSGRLYYGMSDGTMHSLTFDGTDFGPGTSVNLYGLDVQPPTAFTIPGTTIRVPAFSTDLAAMTGMFYDNGRIYYTVSKSGTGTTTTNNMLFYRYFNPESGIVGANLFVADSYPADATIQWANVRGMALASGTLYYALTDGKLYRVGWNSAAGKPTGTPSLVSSATTWQSRGMFVFTPPPPDTTPPTVPGQPAGTSPAAGALRIHWAASSDASPITYDVYRDGGSTPIGTSIDTTFTDTGLDVNSSHTYTVDAVDASNNRSAQSPASAPITVTPLIFSDDFTSDNFTNWSLFTNMTLDEGQGSPSAPSARSQVSSSASYAYADFGFTYGTACASANMNASSLGTTSVDLMRLRSAAGGPIAKVYASSTGVLSVRDDVTGTTKGSAKTLGTGWHNVELCVSVGSPNGSISLFRDGTQILTWAPDTGTTPIGRLQIGDTASKTFTIDWDHVIVDAAPGDHLGPDTTPPTTPGQPVGTSTSIGEIDLSWAASTDDSPPITYRVYRDGNPTPIASTTSTTFGDTGLAPGSSHTYTVDAVDSVDNVSAPSAASAPITVLANAIFVDDFSGGDFSNWTGVTRLSIDNAKGGVAPPSAAGNPSAQSAFAAKTLAATYPNACLSANVNVSNNGGNAIDLLRLRSATAGPIVKAFVNASGILYLRSEFASVNKSSNTALGTGWHNVELCGTVGNATTWDLYRDGIKIVNAWAADTGTDPIGRIQIGDTSSKTWTANFDDVRLDQTPG
jgi:chitodextrinase